MAFYFVCLSRRSLMSLSSSLLHRNLHHHHHLYGASFRRISLLVSSNPCFPSTNLEAAKRRTPVSNSSHLLQWFRSTGSLPSQMNDGEIRGDSKMDKFADNTHWIVDVRFVGDNDIGREEMVEIYVAFAAKVFGSVEEANKRIYSYHTDNADYSFHVECSWDTSRKFKNLPGVSWVSPDHSYLESEAKKHRKRIAESKKRQNQIAESKKHRKLVFKKRVICRFILQRTIKVQADAKASGH